jgi:uncharacterized protein (TIGR03083 family)
VVWHCEGVDVGGYVDALEREGAAFACAAERAGPDAQVPTCPEWTVRELVRHVGYVHRWAATYVREARTVVLDDDEEDAAVGAMPDDADLFGWFRDGHAALVGTLRSAPDDLRCWHFLTAPSPLAFWARRQAHETAIHRADAQSAAAEPVPFAGVPAEFAVDGVDELLLCFYARKGGRLRADEPRRLLVQAIDVPDAAWTVEIGPSGAATSRGAGPADCALRGPAGDLYLALWNRRPTEGLEVAGDEDVLALWRERATVRWT